jgi:hypothetical protein
MKGYIILTRTWKGDKLIMNWERFFSKKWYPKKEIAEGVLNDSSFKFYANATHGEFRYESKIFEFEIDIT